MLCARVCGCLRWYVLLLCLWYGGFSLWFVVGFLVLAGGSSPRVRVVVTGLLCDRGCWVWCVCCRSFTNRWVCCVVADLMTDVCAFDVCCGFDDGCVCI